MLTISHNLWLCSNKHFAQTTLGEAAAYVVWTGHLLFTDLRGYGDPGLRHMYYSLFLCLLALWVRAALTTGPVAFENTMAKFKKTHSLVFGALRDSKVTWCSGGFENRLAYSHYCWLIIALIFLRWGVVFPPPSISKTENNGRIVFLHYSMR